MKRIDELEVWKDIVGNEGLYQVSNFGRVRSVDHHDSLGRLQIGRVLKPQLDGRKNYFHVTLANRKIVQVHTLVAQAFIPNPNNLPQVNHKDENKQNNRADNLEWCTAKYNNSYGSRKNLKHGENHHGAKLTESDVREIKRLWKSGLLQKEIAVMYGMSKQHISTILNGKCWGWVD